MDKCPNCGYCPHCGRSAAPWMPMPYVAPYPYAPWWQQPTWIGWSGTTTIATGGVAGHVVTGNGMAPPYGQWSYTTNGNEA